MLLYYLKGKCAMTKIYFLLLMVMFTVPVLSGCGKTFAKGESATGKTVLLEEVFQEEKDKNLLLHEYWTDLVYYHTEISLNLLYLEEIKSEVWNSRKAELEDKISYEYHDKIIEKHPKVKPLLGIYTDELEDDFIESVKKTREGLGYDQGYIDWVDAYTTKVYNQYIFNVGRDMIEEFMKDTDIDYTLVGLDYIEHNKQKMYVEDMVLTNVNEGGLVIELHTATGKICDFCATDTVLELINDGSYYVVARYKNGNVSLLSKFGDFTLTDHSGASAAINLEWDYSDFAPAPFAIREFYDLQTVDSEWYDNGIFSTYMNMTYPTDTWEYVADIYPEMTNNPYDYSGFQIYIHHCEKAMRAYWYLVPISLATPPEVYAYDEVSNKMKCVFVNGELR